MPSKPPPSPSQSSLRSPDRFLVCGLGSLGEHCVIHLREFGGLVAAIELHPPQQWELANVSECLNQLEIGDCRQPDILRKVGIEQCRAVLIVTSNERVNIETALAARLLNPHVRLVVRSAQQNLNDLLQQQLGNFIAFEPTQLSAIAFALAALQQEVLGLFYLDQQVFEVIQHQVQTGDRWCGIRKVHELNSSHRKVLAHYPAFYQAGVTANQNRSRSSLLYHWEPDAIVQSGDIVITLEAAHNLQYTARSTVSTVHQNTSSDRTQQQRFNFVTFRKWAVSIWQSSRRNRWLYNFVCNCCNGLTIGGRLFLIVDQVMRKFT
jgi:Trk K+ transport system NAD-binding subunit